MSPRWRSTTRFVTTTGVERMFASRRHRRAHDQSAFHRTGKDFQPQYSDWRQLHYLGDREGDQRTVGAAEFRKKREGFVSLGGAYAEPADPDVARMSKIVRSTMTRLHAELMRSISHYRAQQQGNPPQRVFFPAEARARRTSASSSTEKLQLPIEFFNPLRNVAVANSRVAEQQASKSAHLLGELVRSRTRAARPRAQWN